MEQQPNQSKSDGQAAGRGRIAVILSLVEWLGNLLPHPVTLFVLFAIAVVIVSGIGDWMGISVPDPRPPGAAGRADDGTIRVVSLMNQEGFRRIVENLVGNFVNFAPLGTVLVALLGVGVAEKSGLLSAAMRWLVLGAPTWLVTAALVFAGVISNTASEVGYVVLVPLGAAIFYSLGRHPLAGLAAAFAGVSGGYSANLLVGTIDPLLSGITEEAAWIYDANYEVHPAVNWYFMVASTFLVTVLGTWVTVKIVEPSLGKYDSTLAAPEIEQLATIQPLGSEEWRGLKYAFFAICLMFVLFTHFAGPHFNRAEQYARGNKLPHVLNWGEQENRQAEAWLQANLAKPASEREEMVTLFLPENQGWYGQVNRWLFSIPGYGVLRNPDTGDLMRSPFLKSIVALIFLFFLVPGFAYGWALGTMKNDKDIIGAMSDAMSSMGLYIVLVFFAAQFVNFFNWTNFGSIIAVLGSDLIIALRLDGPVVFVPFILLCAFLNLMLGSASAKWAITAPVFVPMLMRIGYSPEVIQAAYRIGDSATNVITPMMSYFGIIFALGIRYNRNMGLGTMISMMLPYTIVFLVVWTAFFYIWTFLLGLPLGPGASTYYQP
jgi:aminobenzoyl-glutamate transport protein